LYTVRSSVISMKDLVKFDIRGLNRWRILIRRSRLEERYTMLCNYVEIKCQLDATHDIYCRFCCMLNIFRAILCPSSGAREYYTDGRCLWYLALWFSGCRYGVELKVMCPVCRLLQYVYNTLELLMMGIVLPETC